VLEQTQGTYGRYTLTCQIRLDRKKTIFALFSTSAFSGVNSWQQSEKVVHGCTTANLPLSNGIKIVSVLQRLLGEIVRTNSAVQNRDGQTNRQTDKNSMFLAAPVADRAPPNLAW